MYNDWFSPPIPFFQPYSHPSVSLPSLPSLSSSSSSSSILLRLAILLPWSCTVELTFKQSSETSFHLHAVLCLFNRDVLHFWDTILLIPGCLWYAASALQKASSYLDNNNKHGQYKWIPFCTCWIQVKIQKFHLNLILTCNIPITHPTQTAIFIHLFW